jgi:3-hydroxy-3-methylglutaryl CoA synthase/uncharacterized OB-fold protein
VIERGPLALIIKSERCRKALIHYNLQSDNDGGIMVGITGFGAYIPRYRMHRKTIFEQLGWFNGAMAALANGEKAVASYDEDTITMAHAAACECLKMNAGREVSALYLASLSLPYVQRQNALIISEALDLEPTVRSADWTGSLKAATTALISAMDAVSANGRQNVLVCAGDCRAAKPGSAQEYTFGDGAAAISVGSADVLAEFKGAATVSHDFIDYRQITREKFLHAWEDRWIREEGYGKIIPEVIQVIEAKYRLGITDFAKLVIPCANSAWLKGLAHKLGARPEQIQDNLQQNVGDTGTALPLMMLISALEQSGAGDKILLLGYGSGSDALIFEVTDKMAGRQKACMDAHLKNRTDLTNYTKYLVFRNLIPLEVGIRGEVVRPTAMSVLWQQGRAVSALVGTRCKVCRTPQYPKHNVCVNPECEAIDQMEPYRFADKVGKVVSFTGDHLAFGWDPPSIYGLVDFEDGGRLLLDFADCSLESVSVGMPVRMSFRRKYADEARGHYGYYWKAVRV